MLIDLATAKTHLRVDGSAEDALIPVWSRAAELLAATYMNRTVFETDAGLATAVALVPAALSTAGAAYDAAVLAAVGVTDVILRDEALAYASATYQAALAGGRATRAGIVINELIKAAMLLILGHLYANRENVIVGAAPLAVPMGAERLLAPYRVGMGI